jgi:TATA-binding protein-associated factor Taf7
MKETEEFLAAELSKLSAIERTKATEDVHCVGGELEESPELVERSLLDFDAQVKRENDQIYGLAVSQNRAYVENRIFRLKFLRADLHDVKKAVRRMMKFLNHKLTSFGVHKLTQEITLADLNEEDIFLMKSGLFHIQEDKDQSGRIVIYVFNRMLGQCTSEALVSLNSI